MENTVNTQATNTETQKNNKLIAEFMGYENVSKTNHHPIYKIPNLSYELPDFDHRMMDAIDTFSPYFDDMKFHTDWNWLMSVIKEIGDRTDFELVMGYGHCYWNNEGEQPLGNFEGGYGDIIYIYTAVIEFIKWYNGNE